MLRGAGREQRCQTVDTGEDNPDDEYENSLRSNRSLEKSDLLTPFP
jgi:hypothetical protein